MKQFLKTFLRKWFSVEHRASDLNFVYQSQKRKPWYPQFSTKESLYFSELGEISLRIAYAKLNQNGDKSISVELLAVVFAYLLCLDLTFSVISMQQEKPDLG